MKRQVVLAAALVAAMALTACGSSSDSSTSTTAAAAASSETEAAASAPTGSITFTFAMADNTSSNYYQGALAIADAINEATDGLIGLNIQAGGTLGGESDTLDQAIMGDLDIATCANSVLENYIPEMAILDKAFLWDSADQANYAVRHEVGDLIAEKALEKGLHVVGYMESGFRDVFSNRPIEKMDDFKGLKIRVMQNDGQLMAFTAFGANPIALSANDQFTALQQGTIDACENAVSNCWVNQFYEAGINSITNTKHCFVYIPICVSDNAWNQIPDEYKDAFVDAVWEGCEKQWQYLIDANDDAIAELENVGVTFYDIDRDELKATYEEALASSGTSYDPAWEAAVDAAIAAVD